MDEMGAGCRAPPVLELTTSPDSRQAWAVDVWNHLPVLYMLARKDFQTRYKRASLGILWAVAVPLLQASIMATVFSRVVKVGAGHSFAVHVMSGVMPFTYFSAATVVASTAIVDGTDLTERVWFPRSILALVPVLSGLVGLLVSLVALVAATSILGGSIGLNLLLLFPATALLIVFTASLSLVLSALHVYFRDVRFLVQAALMVWMYLTPILYPVGFLGRLAVVAYLNPLTGIVSLFQQATGTASGSLLLAVADSVMLTLILFVAGIEAQRRHDRLFVDLL